MQKNESVKSPSQSSLWYSRGPSSSKGKGINKEFVKSSKTKERKRRKDSEKNGIPS
jgi:hypothetical protein